MAEGSNWEKVHRAQTGEETTQLERFADRLRGLHPSERHRCKRIIPWSTKVTGFEEIVRSPQSQELPRPERVRSEGEAWRGDALQLDWDRRRPQLRQRDCRGPLRRRSRLRWRPDRRVREPSIYRSSAWGARTAALRTEDESPHASRQPDGRPGNGAGSKSGCGNAWDSSVAVRWERSGANPLVSTGWRRR